MYSEEIACFREEGKFGMVQYKGDGIEMGILKRFVGKTL